MLMTSGPTLIDDQPTPILGPGEDDGHHHAGEARGEMTLSMGTVLCRGRW